MDSTEDDIVRRTQVQASLALILEQRAPRRGRGPVREQFEDDLRALTEAEQDSKELKSAKRHLLFDRIERRRRAALPGRPGDGRRRRAAGQGRAHAASSSSGRPRRSTRTSSASKIAVDKRRPDGRDAEEIRPIECEVGVSPRTHGSALFTRGQTQIMTPAHARHREGGAEDRRPLPRAGAPLHAPLQLPALLGRRDGLHARAEAARHRPRSARAARARGRDPGADEFPYTIRIVSETLESNGSSSMGSVCGSTLALMDAGVPIKAPVSGIAMGLVKEGDDYVILTDIQGAEDHLGDMDFKVAGYPQRDHRAPDGHQDHRRHAADHARRARAGEAGPRVHPRADGRGDAGAARGARRPRAADLDGQDQPRVHRDGDRQGRRDDPRRSSPTSRSRSTSRRTGRS